MMGGRLQWCPLAGGFGMISVHAPSSRRGGVAILAGCGLLLLLLLAHPSAVRAESRVVEARGIATIVDGNVALARDGAVSDALRKAVEQAVGTLVSSETMVENFAVLSDRVYTRTRGYIKDYTVTGEGQSGALYQVSVRATVEMGELKDDLDALGLLMRRVGKPRVLFMVAEQNIGDSYYVFWWKWWGTSEFHGETYSMLAGETALKEAFLSKGFNVVDISGTTGAFEISNAFRVADLTADGARTIGGRLGAEVVVTGKVVAREGPRTPGSRVAPYLADMTLQAVRVGDGAVLGSASGHGVARHISPVSGGSQAIAKAAAQAGERLMEQIIAKWTGGAMTVRIKIRGLADYGQLTAVKDMLRGRVRGVKAVYQRSFEGGEAELDVEADSTAQQMADAIASAKLGFPLSIVKATQSTIELVVGR